MSKVKSALLFAKGVAGVTGGIGTIAGIGLAHVVAGAFGIRLSQGQLYLISKYQFEGAQKAFEEAGKEWNSSNYSPRGNHSSAGKKKKSWKPRFNFKIIDIPPRAKLTFKDNKSITCRVVNSTSVEFEGKVMTLKAATLRAFERTGNPLKTPISSVYWEYNGEMLSDRFSRMKEEILKNRPHG